MKTAATKIKKADPETHGAALTRILVADDHPVVRLGVRNLLSGEAGFALAGEAADGEEAIELTRKLNPHILLLDLAMPRLTGLDVLRRLATDEALTRVIILTANINQREVVEALRLGARGIVLKDMAASDVLSAVRATMDGQYWFGRQAVTDLVDALNKVGAKRERPYRLTARQLEVVAAVVGGETNKNIAQKLSISEDTVKRHLTNVFDKTGVSTRLELALFAIHHQLLSTSE